MHPALRKGPLFYTKHPPFPTFFTKKTPCIFHFTKNTPPISFPAYGPVIPQNETVVCQLYISRGC